MAFSNSFEDTPFGTYDTTPGTERFPDGWYPGTVTRIADAGGLDGRKQVKVCVQLDDLPLVQRKMGVAWGNKDNNLSAWMMFLTSVLRKSVGDPSLREARPRDVIGKRVMCYLAWSARGYMDITKFAPFAAAGLAGEPPAIPPRDADAAAPASATPPGNRAVYDAARRGAPAPAPRAATAGLTPGQRRCLTVATESGVSEETLRGIIAELFGKSLEEVADPEVAAITRAVRQPQAASA